MSMNESVAYLKGLAEGLELDKDTKEGKLLTAMIDVLDEMAAEISDVEEQVGELDELVDTILEGDIDCPSCGQNLEFDLEGCDCGDGECGCCHHDHEEH